MPDKKQETTVPSTPENPTPAEAVTDIRESTPAPEATEAVRGGMSKSELLQQYASGGG